MAKKTFLTLLILFLGTTIFTFTDYYLYINAREQKSIAAGDNVVSEITHGIETVLAEIETRTRKLADSLSKNDIRGHALIELIEQETNAMTQILGVTVAYEPFAYNDSVRLFSPYFDKKAGEIMYLGQLYDYTDGDVTRWYVDVVDNGPSWIEPYYGQGAHTMITDFGVPFYRENPKTGESELVGTVTLTVSLDDFTKLLNSLSLGKTGYGFIISKKGDFIAHPISEYVSNKNILEVAREHQDSILAKVGQLMIDGQSGHEQFVNSISDQISYLFYNQIQYAHWNLGVVFIKNELLGNPLLLRRKMMHICFSLSALLLVGFCVLTRIHRIDQNKLWNLSIMVSSLIVINICIIWFLTVKFTVPFEGQERHKITNPSTLNRFINLERSRAKDLHVEEPVVIPTGIYINEIEFSDSYNVNISATIWQLYDHATTEGIERKIYFPQTSPFSEALIVEKEEVKKKSADLVTWHVRGTYRLDFDYSTYPFDFRHLDLKINHPNKERNIILAPHLKGYKIVTQSSKPGVNNNAVLPESEVDASYFDYTMETYNANFGLETFLREETPQLHFNMILKRKFINAFVSNIIPILIVALMLFFLVYGTSKKDSPRKGLSSIGVVESSAAFFFVLLLAHIDHRKIVNTPVITYMEFFYFIMYLILALVAFNIVMFTKKDNYLFFDYQDNFILKISYWPLFLGMCFMITLIRFY